MNRKAIKRVLQSKHKEFCLSVTDKDVRELVEKNSFITGGSIVSMLDNEPIKDFDYYFTDQKTCEAVAEYYIKEFLRLSPNAEIKPEMRAENGRVKIHIQSAGAAREDETNKYGYFETMRDEDGEAYADAMTEGVTQADDTPMPNMDEKEPYRPVFLSANAITLSNKVQLVIRFYGSPEEVHKNYDFIHCTCYWIAEKNELVLPAAALESILVKHLHYVGSLYPVCSVIRTRKFLKRGWYINAGQYLKMCFQCSELDLKDVDVLEEQLTGVDAAYFIEIVNYCRKRMDKDPEFNITMPYLASIIDKIF